MLMFATTTTDLTIAVVMMDSLSTQTGVLAMVIVLC